jgi:hypothetical protein
MQVSASATASRLKKKSASSAGNPDFIIHISLLGGFIGLVGYLAVVCHHMH